MAIRIVYDPPGCAAVSVTDAGIIDVEQGDYRYSGRNIRIDATVFKGYRFRGFTIVTHYETHRGRSEDIVDNRNENPAIGDYDTRTPPYEYEATHEGEFYERRVVTEIRIRCDIAYKVRLSVYSQKAAERGCEVGVLGERGTDIEGVYWLQAGQGVNITVGGYGVKGLRCIAFKEGDIELPLSGQSEYDAYCTIADHDVTSLVKRTIVAIFGHERNINGTGLPYYGSDGSIVFADSDGSVLCDDYPDE